jgi:ribosomal protein L31
MSDHGSIHPKFRVVTVREPNGFEYQVRSAATHDPIIADISAADHPAWNGKMVVRNTGEVEKFNNRFALDFLTNS